MLEEEASDITARLCTDAIWHENCCNWVGRSPAELSRWESFTPAVTSLDGDLYAGTSGIALALAIFAVLIGDPKLRDTSNGAAKHSLRRAPRLAAKSKFGLFDGVLGISLAALIVGQQLDRGDLVLDAVRLARETLSNLVFDRDDIISGRAGAILALLLISRLSGDEEFLAAAEELGVQLRNRHEIWAPLDGDNQQRRGPAALTGFAHGASGIGLSLLILDQAVSRSGFREECLRAFRYERRMYVPDHENWLDLRGLQESNKEARFVTAWCHGAPGIGLARIAAISIVPGWKDEFSEDVVAARQTTDLQIRSYAFAEGADCTICHGLAGLLEFSLVDGGCSQRPANSERVQQVWKTVITKRRERGRWLTGTPSGGRNPTLMLGEAGIAYSLARALSPESIPSVCLPLNLGCL